MAILDREEQVGNHQWRQRHRRATPRRERPPPLRSEDRLRRHRDHSLSRMGPVRRRIRRPREHRAFEFVQCVRGNSRCRCHALRTRPVMQCAIGKASAQTLRPPPSSSRLATNAISWASFGGSTEGGHGRCGLLSALEVRQKLDIIGHEPSRRIFFQRFILFHFVSSPGNRV